MSAGATQPGLVILCGLAAVISLLVGERWPVLAPAAATAALIVASTAGGLPEEAALAPRAARGLMDHVAGRSGPDPEGVQAVARLTDREREVLIRLAHGLTNAEIAQVLVVSEATAKTHVSNVLAKLGVRDRTQAVIVAYTSGLV